MKFTFGARNEHRRLNMLWTIFIVSSDFVASGFQPAYWRGTDPLASGCGFGSSGH
jgi:hypothetical protein